MGWESAQATVKARKESGKFALQSVETQSRFEYAMEIQPNTGEAPFMTKMETPMKVDRWRPLNVGEVVKVLFNPKNKEVKWDKKEPSTSRKAAYEAGKKQIEEAEDKAFEAAMAGEESDELPDMSTIDPELQELIDQEKSDR